MTTPAAVRPHALAAELAAARARTDFLFRLLTPEAIYARPIPERHRMIFYIGHLEAFDWNMIWRRTLELPSFHPEFDRLFEFGIDPPEGSLPVDTEADWPRLEEVREYCSRVRDKLDPVLAEAPEQVLRVALEHRWMHAETLAYLLHNLPYQFKTDPSGGAFQNSAVQPVDRGLIEIPAGFATLGQTPGEFGWDNEFDEHRIAVPAFSIGRFKVTNADYLAFVNAGADPPFFWTHKNGSWFYRGMFQSLPLPPQAPAYVTHEQAEAYARWKGLALPSEAQFHRAAYGTPQGDERPWPWGNDAPSAERGNFDFHAWDPVNVDATPAGDSAFGAAQMVGNGWEWTSTPFGPFPGFRTFPVYPGYSQPFFDGDHFVMKGGSPQTAAPLLRRSFRNWFRRRYPYAYGAFRLVANAG